MEEQVVTELTQDEKNLAKLMHWGGGIFCFWPSLIIYLVKKDSAFVTENTKIALNYQICIAIAYFVLTILSLIPFVGCITIFIVLGLMVANLVFSIKAGNVAETGELPKYPFKIDVLK